MTIKEVPKEKLNPAKKKSQQPSKDEMLKTIVSCADCEFDIKLLFFCEICT